MRSRRLGATVAATVALAATAVLVIPASASALTIRADRYRVTQLGHFHPAGNPDLAHAIHAFGKPTGRHHHNSGCLVRWRKLKLRIDFENFGGHDPCSKKGRAQSFTIGFEKRWRTSRRLRVGQSVERLKDRYRHARRHGSEYWLKSAYSPFGTGTHYAVLAARTHHLRFVSGFSGRIGGAGE